MIHYCYLFLSLVWRWIFWGQLFQLFSSALQWNRINQPGRTAKSPFLFYFSPYIRVLFREKACKSTVLVEPSWNNRCSQTANRFSYGERRLVFKNITHIYQSKKMLVAWKLVRSNVFFQLWSIGTLKYKVKHVNRSTSSPSILLQHCIEVEFSCNGFSKEKRK